MGMISIYPWDIIVYLSESNHFSLSSVDHHWWEITSLVAAFTDGTISPWINNCVGHNNYAHFLRFLILVDICCTYHLVLMTKRATSTVFLATHYVVCKFCCCERTLWLNFLQGDPSITELVFMILNFMFCIPVLLCVGIFRWEWIELWLGRGLDRLSTSLYHFYCAATNSTTVEGLDKDKVARMVKRGRIQEVWISFRHSNRLFDVYSFQIKFPYVGPPFVTEWPDLKCSFSI